jgi:hypothetical protein
VRALFRIDGPKLALRARRLAQLLGESPGHLDFDQG